MTATRARSVLILILLMLVVGAPSVASPRVEPTSPRPAARLAGHWEGAIELPGTRLEIDTDFSQRDDGTWIGDISIPMQGARNLQLADIQIDDDGLAFKLPGVPGAPAFKGRIAGDGETISGEFSQGGQTFPFKLSRGPDVEAEASAALQGFDDVVTAAMKEFKVPGLAMAIVKDGKVVLSKGYGLRDTERSLPVTPQTLFAIGSATKAFTTFVLATLVDEGKLEWDEPVQTYIPSFKLQDSFASARITPRDLVTHRSGLPRHDLVWYNSDMTREEMVARLAHLEPYRDLRSEYHYQNLMYLTAGYLAERVTGRPWEDLVRERIFDPLDMTRSNFSVAESQKAADFALPYEEKDDLVKVMPFRDITNVGPAGSINSSIDEMIRWVQVHLNRGMAGDRRMVGEATLVDMHTPRMAISVPPDEPETPEISYALGWFVEPYRGHNRIHHGGNIDGFSALVSILPQDGIGMVVLTNLNGNPMPGLVMRHAIDRLLKLEPRDWIGEAQARRLKRKEANKEAEKKKETVRKSGTKPAHSLSDYAGEYGNPGYGLLRVAAEGGRLTLTYNNIVTPLEHWHYEVFEAGKDAKDLTLEGVKFMFLTNMKGEVDAVQTPFEPEVKDIVFTRRPDARLLDPVYLRQFTGQYELVERTVTIELKGRTLTVNLPGQPQYELVPDRGTEFNLKGMSGYSVRFTVHPKDGVTEAVFNQPNGVFTAKRKR